MFSPAVKAEQTRLGSRRDVRGPRVEDGDHRRSPPVPRRHRHLLLRHGQRRRPALYPASRRAAGLPEAIGTHTLAFADFAGNRQYITLGHLKENDRAHIFILHFATQQRVKLWGRARVVEGDLELMERLVDPAYKARPERAIVFTLEAWDANCPQHIVPRYSEAEIAPGINKLVAAHQGAGGRSGAAEGRVLTARPLRPRFSGRVPVMKILVANPNTSTGVTDRLVAAGRLVASPGTELMPMTAPRGVPYIATRAEAAIGAGAALEMLAEGAARSMRRSSPPSAIPAWAARASCSTFPVVGMAEAAMLVACTLGRNFAIVSFAKSLEPWFAEIVAWHGLSGRCAAIRTLDEAFRSIDDVQDEKEQVLVDLANSTVAERWRRRRSSWPARRLPASPTRSASACRCRWSTASRPPSTMAEGLVRLNPRKADRRHLPPAGPKDSKGLSTALADVIGHQ